MKKYLITGLLIWIPLVITLWVLKLIFDMLDQSLLLLPEPLQTEHWLGVHIPGLGAILTLVDHLLHRRRSPPTSSARSWSSSGTTCCTASRW